MVTTFDAIVIGTGQSGPSLAERLTAAGKKVAVIERKRFGGTCVNNGCIPTKTMVASAYAAHAARRAAEYGVAIGGAVTVDMKKVKARKDAIVQKSTRGVEQWLKGMANATVIEGHARLTGPHAVVVGNHALEAPAIFLNVGARAETPKIPGLDRVPYLNNSSIMEVDYLPEHLIVLGGSYIGLEFGQMFRRFGARVTVVNRGPRLLAREDDDVAEAVRAILTEEGIEILTDTADLKVEGSGTDLRLSGSAGGRPFAVSGSHILAATGRRPNTDDLGLDTAGIATDKRGFVATDEGLMTNVPGVCALGDCNGRAAFTHTSYNDFQIVAENLLDGARRRVSERILAYAVFIDPPLGRVGMTEREVRARGRPALIATMPMTDSGRAREKGETKGFMKILVDPASERFLGAALLGVGCDEVVHTLIDVMTADAPYTVVKRAVHIHPTVSEALPWLMGTLKQLP